MTKAKTILLNELDIAVESAHHVLSNIDIHKGKFGKQLTLAMARKDVRGIMTEFHLFKDQVASARAAARRAGYQLVLSKVPTRGLSYRILEVKPL